MASLKQKMIADLLIYLAEYESGVLDSNQTLKELQRCKIQTIYHYVGESVPEEYWESLENI